MLSEIGGIRCVVSLAGEFQLKPSEGANFQLKGRKAAALVAYLLMTRAGFASRERLAGLLWSEHTESSARAALRQCLKRAQSELEAFEQNFLWSDRNSIGVRRDLVTSDLDCFLADATSGRMPLLGLPDMLNPERILHGLDDLDPAFTAWLRVTRESWVQQATACLMGILLDEGADLTARLGAAEALFAADPTNEAAARLLIERQIRAANPAAALTLYERLWRALDEAWGEEPSGDLQAKIVHLKTASGPVPSDPARPASAAVRLALMPFHQGGPSQQPEYYVEGLQRELTAAMVRFREWKVLDGRIPGATKKADYRLEGSYLDVEDQAQLTVTLMECTENAYIMSDTVRISYGEWTKSLRRIIRRISVALNIHLTRHRLETTSFDPGVGANVFDIWLRANRLLTVWRRENCDEAERLCQDVIARAPDFAAAYATIAEINNARHLYAPGTAHDPQMGHRARVNAQRAVALDPLDTRNQLALGWAHAMSKDFVLAEQAFELAGQLNPNSPQTIVPSAHGLSFCGRHEDANHLIDLALDFDLGLLPEHWGYVACVRFFVGRYRDCVEACEKSGDAILDIVGWQASALGQLGRHAEARRHGEALVERICAHWAGDGPATAEAVTEWFLKSFPIRNAEDQGRLRDGLAAAGLPA